MATSPEIMRDCVKERFDNGAEEGSRNHSAYLISLEFKRVGSSKEEALHELIKWNRKNDPPFKLSEIEKSIKTPLNEVYDNDEIKFLSCKKEGSLRKNRICLLDSKEIKTCQFLERNKRIADLRRSCHYDETKYNHYHWEDYLIKKYHLIGHYAHHFYRELVRLELIREYSQGHTILVGYRYIEGRIKLENRDLHPSTSQLWLASKKLEEEGLIRRVVQGKRGTTRRFANGYQRVLPLPRPQKPRRGASP